MRTQGSSNSSDWISGALKNNPEGLLLLAAGAALLLRRGALVTESIPSSATRSSTRSGRGSGLSQAVSGVQEAAADVADRAKETAESVVSSVSNYASKASRTVGDQSSRMAGQAQSAAKRTIDRVLQEQPWAVAVAGLAAGAAIAAVFPPTKFEQKHLGAIGDEIAGAAQRVADQLKDATSKAGETLTDAVAERGLSTQGRKDVASEVAGAGAFTEPVGGSSGTSGAPNTASSSSSKKGG